MNMFISPIICEPMIMSKYGSKLVFLTLRKLIRSITDGFPHHFTLLHSWWVDIWHNFWGSILIFAFWVNLIFWKFEADWSWEYKIWGEGYFKICIFDRSENERCLLYKSAIIVGPHCINVSWCKWIKIRIPTPLGRILTHCAALWGT